MYANRKGERAMAYLTALLADWRVFSILWVLHLGYSSWLSALVSAQTAVRTRWLLRSFWWKLLAVGLVFWFAECVIIDDTTALQATLSTCVLITMLRTAYRIGHWNGTRARGPQ